ncbi:MAG: fused MFS/spermidine synthase [Verrucomicrobiales bacterium]|nr:fused MFS/spermidine synthase [Verrucomicrobiales bacterium]
MKAPNSNLILVVAIALGVIAMVVGVLTPRGADQRFGSIILETQSDFSHIRIREKGPIRSLLFVDKNGVEQCQSSINIEAPAEHQLGYTKSLFASLLYHYPQNRVLIVGLGGGGMVQFLNFTFPTMRVEAVEIDPVVVSLAAEYFKTQPGPLVKIHTADVFDFLEEEHGRYDVIYMDAFLQPPANSPLEEKTRRLKTVNFLTSLQTHLAPDGLVAFNIIPAESEAKDNLAAIKEAFASTFTFNVPGTGNLVIIACKQETTATSTQLLERAERLDDSLALDFSFRDIATSLKQP